MKKERIEYYGYDEIGYTYRNENHMSIHMSYVFLRKFTVILEFDYYYMVL